MITAGAWLGEKLAVAAAAARYLFSDRRIRQRTEPPPAAQQDAAASARSADSQAGSVSASSDSTVVTNWQAAHLAQAQQEWRPRRHIKKKRHVSSSEPSPAAAVADVALKTEPSQKPSYKQQSRKRPRPEDESFPDEESFPCPRCNGWDTEFGYDHGDMTQPYFFCETCGFEITVDRKPIPRDAGGRRIVPKKDDAAAHNKGAAPSTVAPHLQAPLTTAPSRVAPMPPPAPLPSNARSLLAAMTTPLLMPQPSNAPSMSPPSVSSSRRLVNLSMPGAVPPGCFGGTVGNSPTTLGGTGGNFPPTFGVVDGIPAFTSTFRVAVGMPALPPVAQQHLPNLTGHLQKPQHQGCLPMLGLSWSSYHPVPHQ